MTIANLFARIGLKTDEHKAKSFSNAMSGVKSVMFAATAAAGAASAAIAKVTSDALNAAAAFTQFETETGASAQTLQKWQSVAEQTNNSAESVTNSIKAIADNQAKIRLGQGNISGYQLLGIDPNQDPFEIMKQIGAATKNMSVSMRKNITSMFGVNASMLQMLDLSQDRFEAMASNGFIISPGAIKSLNSTKSALNLMGRAVKWLKAQIAVGLAPQIKKMTLAVSNFVKVNKQGFIDGFKKAFTFVSKFATMIGRAAMMINNIVTSTIGWKTALIGITAAFIAMKAGFFLSPLGLMVAGFLALALVLEDLYVYSKGGESLFGRLMTEFPKVGAAINAIMKPISEAFSLIAALITGDELKANEILDSWGEFGDFIQDAAKKIGDLIQMVKNIAQGKPLLAGVTDKDGNLLIDAEQVVQQKEDFKERRKEGSLSTGASLQRSEDRATMWQDFKASGGSETRINNISYYSIDGANFNTLGEAMSYLEDMSPVQAQIPGGL